MKLTGEWAAVARVLSGAGGRLTKGIDQALRQEALHLQAAIVRGLRDQAPGSSPIRPLAETTLAKRRLRSFRGTKALLERADLLRSITVRVEGTTALVGVDRKARSKTGHPVIDIAQRNEFGAAPVVIPLTDKSRRFLFALLAEASGAGGGAPTGGRVPGAVVVRIPPRPFLRPAYEATRAGAAARFLKRVAQGVLR